MRRLLCLCALQLCLCAIECAHAEFHAVGPLVYPSKTDPEKCGYRVAISVPSNKGPQQAEELLYLPVRRLHEPAGGVRFRARVTREELEKLLATPLFRVVWRFLHEISSSRIEPQHFFIEFELKVAFGDPNRVQFGFVGRNSQTHLSSEYIESQDLVLEADCVQKGSAKEWGPVMEGVKTRLTANSANRKKGEPIRLTLELMNITGSAVRYDAQVVGVNNSLKILAPDGTDVPYTTDFVQTLGGLLNLPAGAIYVLFDGLNPLTQYCFTKPGEYTIQFRGASALSSLHEEPSVSIPPSNVIHLRVGQDDINNAPCPQQRNTRTLFRMN